MHLSGIVKCSGIKIQYKVKVAQSWFKVFDCAWNFMLMKKTGKKFEKKDMEFILHNWQLFVEYTFLSFFKPNLTFLRSLNDHEKWIRANKNRSYCAKTKFQGKILEKKCWSYFFRQEKLNVGSKTFLGVERKRFFWMANYVTKRKASWYQKGYYWGGGGEDDVWLHHEDVYMKGSPSSSFILSLLCNSLTNSRKMSGSMFLPNW